MSRLSTWDRFVAKVDKTPTCWLWTGCKTGHGHGTFTVGGRTVPAHRFAYEQAGGRIPPGLLLYHRCHVRHCVNPAHVEIITNSEKSIRSSPNPGRCRAGHPHTAEYGHIRNDVGGAWTCRACNNLRAKRHRTERATPFSALLKRLWKCFRGSKRGPDGRFATEFGITVAT